MSQHSMNEDLRHVLMRRDNITWEEADDLVCQAQEALYEYLAENDLESAYNICQEFFGLEPDFLDQMDLG